MDKSILSPFILIIAHGLNHGLCEKTDIFNGFNRFLKPMRNMPFKTAQGYYRLSFHFKGDKPSLSYVEGIGKTIELTEVE